MLNKIMARLGLGSSGGGNSTEDQFCRPYRDEHLNVLYNLLFCDNLDLFRRQDETPQVEPWPVLLTDRPSPSDLRAIADHPACEGRLRALAYYRLRELGERTPPKILLGVVIEVPMGQGLDVLAVFFQSSVRYLNYSGRVAIFEGAGNPVEPLSNEVLALAQPIVDRIGPWEKPRLGPPNRGNVRMTFLVSDGLYFGEGPFEALRKDALAGPLLAKANELLQRVVELAGRESP